MNFSPGKPYARLSDQMSYHADGNGGVPTVAFSRSPILTKSDHVHTATSTATLRANPKKGRQPRKARNNWTFDEDAFLLRIVENHVFEEESKNHWAVIAEALKTQRKGSIPRTGKQCRDRWQNHLRSGIKKGCWTKQEEILIKDMHKAFGTKWSCMAKLMPNRTDNDIKNKWYSMVRQEQKKHKSAQQGVTPVPAVGPVSAVAAASAQEEEAPSIQSKPESLPTSTQVLFSGMPILQNRSPGASLQRLGAENLHGSAFHRPNLSAFTPSEEEATVQAPSNYNWTFNYPHIITSYYDPQLVVGQEYPIPELLNHDSHVLSAGPAGIASNCTISGSNYESMDKEPISENDDSKPQAVPMCFRSTPDAAARSAFDAV